MAFTDHSDLFAAVHENGINATIGQLMLQRPSMFNYATILFTQALRSQLCVPIPTPPGGGPLFTVEPPLPVLGAPRPLGLDWCLQLTNVSVDLYPGNTLTLPPELDPIGRQQFALHLRACFGLACPDDRVVENLTAEMEAAVAASMAALVSEASSQRGDRLLDGPEGGQQDHVDVRHDRLGRPQELEPGQSRHSEIRHDQVDAAGDEQWPREYFPVQKLVVHHTAGRNADPDPAATVRAIYYYHAVTRRWADIGYNYLIDEQGRVYEGRYARDFWNGATPSSDNLAGLGVAAGHTKYYNQGTMGIALLGTFTSQAPTPAAHASLVRMLAWASAKYHIDPTGAALYVNPEPGVTGTQPNIAGHRDYASTACPGGVLYATLPSIRAEVAAHLARHRQPQLRARRKR